MNSNSVKLLDKRPIQLEGFVLRAGSARAVGTPTEAQIIQDLKVVTSFHDASGYWIGDILRYVKDREDLSDRIEEIMGETGLARQTLYNRIYVSRHVDLEMRALAPTDTHAAQVASLEPKKQKELLTRARDEGWKVHELKAHVRVATRPAIVQGQAKLKGKYRVIYADCPWKYRQKNATVDGSLKKAEQEYPTLSIKELMALPVERHAMNDAILFMWATAPMLLENPGPRDVLEAWGFTYKSNRVWDKVKGMPGSYGMQVKHEHLIIATRGSCLPDVPTPNEDSVEVLQQRGQHSAKPEEFREWIMRHWIDGPYLELFGRRKVEGWTVFGNDARLWA